eukprot:TRINITY_DN121017_c0_g1_i1.p1 TRINITY_DN121017_c0_g1~~TRINITY_DN121017_c0_g1_i1.p1  ORF type:complete len:380 (+),score=59.32 TRINITY_DN121017_c0_g1_i1:98-1237(+)
MAPSGPEPDFNSNDFYRILGVERSASDKEITAAYRKLALRYHPDKNPDDKENAEHIFKQVTEAYETLHDSQKRAEYDQIGRGLGGGGYSGFNTGGVSFTHADDIFNHFFGNDSPFPGTRMGGSAPKAAHFSSSKKAPHSKGADYGFGFGDYGRGKSGFGDIGFDFIDMLGSKDFYGQGCGKPASGFGTFPESFLHGKSCGRQQRASADGVATMPGFVLPRGAQVVIRGLEISQEHNGKTAKVLSWDASRSRYEVCLEDAADREQKLSLRPKNLTQRCPVEVVGLEAKPEINGCRGEILAFDEDRGHYVVAMDGKQIRLGIRPANCMLDHGRRVTLQGLSDHSLNGQMAKILEVDRLTAKYTVECEGGRTIRVKFERVLC